MKKQDSAIALPGETLLDRILRGGYEPLFIDMYGARWTDPDTYRPLGTAARFEDWEFSYAAVIAQLTTGRTTDGR